MDSPLQMLHFELLHQISEILDSTHPPSLLAFALTCKGCYAVASTLLHRTIKLQVKTVDVRQLLVPDIKGWSTVLARDGGFAHVRRLFLFFSDDPKFQSHYLSLEPCERDGDNDFGLRNCWDIYNEDLWPDPSVTIPDEEWQPVARLVRQLTGLTDLFWACPAQLPPCLLEALLEDLGHCRLHDYSFHLSRPTRKPHFSYDRAVATSPNLYSIGAVDRNDVCPALGGLVRNLQPPRLKRIHFWSYCNVIEPDEKDLEFSQPVSRECIQVERAASNQCVSFDFVAMLASGDFSTLRVLKLKVPLVRHGLPPASSFPSLLTLAYKSNPERSSEYRNEEETVFLRNLPRLSNLQIKNWDRTLSIVPGLNPNLRVLDLRTKHERGGPLLLDDHIYQLSELCPQLEELAIEIKRSRGDAAEVARYRAIGRLSRLHRLDLHLDASPPAHTYHLETIGDPSSSRGTLIEAWFDDQDAIELEGDLRPHRQGHVRDVFINSAVDATLARSIFEVIDGAKGHAPGVRRLDRLALRASGGNYFPPRGRMVLDSAPLRPFLRALRRRWLVERDVRDDARDVIHVRETHADDRLYKFQDHTEGRTRKSGYLFGLWRRVWPIERDGIPWWDGWESSPLDLGT